MHAWKARLPVGQALPLRGEEQGCALGKRDYRGYRTRHGEGQALALRGEGGEGGEGGEEHYWNNFQLLPGSSARNVSIFPRSAIVT